MFQGREITVLRSFWINQRKLFPLVWVAKFGEREMTKNVQAKDGNNDLSYVDDKQCAKGTAGIWQLSRAANQEQKGVR